MKFFTARNLTYLCMLLLGRFTGEAFALDSKFETKTKVRLSPGGIWLEAEISPFALVAALPLADHNHDGRLDEEELSNRHTEILNYFAARVNLAAEGKTLRADSTYFAFRSPATPAAMPDRFYIYHWYAMLRDPERLRVENALFCELQPACEHHGAIVNGERMFKFDFNQNPEAVSSERNHVVEFELGGNGAVALVDPNDHTLQAGYIWIGLGLFGFIFFRLASAARNRWSREEEDDEFEEIGFPESPVLNRANVPAA